MKLGLRGGFGYGLFMAAIVVLLTLLFDDLTALAGFALLAALHLLALSWAPWLRLGLRATSVGFALAGLLWGALAVRSLLEQRPLLELLTPLAVGLLVASSLLPLLDRRFHRGAWERWSAATARASILDVVLGRHVPR